MAVKPSDVHTHKERADFLLKEECKLWEAYIDKELLAQPLDSGRTTRVLLTNEMVDEKNNRKIDYLMSVYRKVGWKVKYEPYPIFGEVVVSFIFEKP